MIFNITYDVVLEDGSIHTIKTMGWNIIITDSEFGFIDYRTGDYSSYNLTDNKPSTQLAKKIINIQIKQIDNNYYLKH